MGDARGNEYNCARKRSVYMCSGSHGKRQSRPDLSKPGEIRMCPRSAYGALGFNICPEFQSSLGTVFIEVFPSLSFGVHYVTAIKPV